MSFITFPARIEGANFANTSIGYGALRIVVPTTTTGTNNTAFGYSALSSTTTGRFNTAIGSNAMLLNSSGSSNTAIGDYALEDNLTGTFNTAIGRGSLSSTDSIGSTGIGANALSSATGGGNTAVGYAAGNLITTGQNNTILGLYSGNQGGLDIRTLSGYVVLSDGLGNPRLYIDPTGLVTAPGGFAGVGGAITFNNRTAAYTVVAGDLGKIVNCTTGTFTVALTAAATLGAGFACWVWNTGTGTITINPNASETIDGILTITLRSGEGCQIVCNGTNWETGDKKTPRQYAENTSAATVRPSASGTNSIAMGVGAVASGGTSIALGASAQVTTSAVALGFSSAANGNASIAIGSLFTYGSPTANGTNSIAIGDGTNANGIRSIAIGNASASNEIGKYSYAAGYYSAFGDCQQGTLILRSRTSNATPSVLTSDGGAASSSNQLALVDSTAFAFTGTVVARQSSALGTQSAAWRVEGLIRRETGAATTTLVASSVTVISNVPGWGLALSADTVNGCLAVTATGAVTNIQWVSVLQTSENTYI